MKILAYVNHYAGRPVGFEGRSTDGSPGRTAIVEECIAGLRALPGAEVNVCGIAGHALVGIDIDLSHVRDNPRLLVYESLAHMAARVDDFDYFVNIEDDILLPPETFSNVIEFDRESLVNEVLHPNRVERDPAGVPFCVDLKAMPGWTYQRRTYRGHELRVALNPHSAVLILSREKLRYVLRHIDTGYRGRFLSYEMDSALAYYHSPLSLYRPYDDLDFHVVQHLDPWAGSRMAAKPPAAASPPLAASARQRRWKTAVKPFVPPILLSLRRRRHRSRG